MRRLLLGLAFAALGLAAASPAAAIPDRMPDMGPKVIVISSRNGVVTQRITLGLNKAVIVTLDLRFRHR